MQVFAFAQSYTSFLTGSATDKVVSPLGGICLMGGSTESDDAMRWFLQRCNGGDVLVLRASGSDGYNDYLFSELGETVNSVETIVCNNASASQSAYIHQRIKKADGIWFAGGDQWNYVLYWRGTPIDSLVNEAIMQRNIVIGGTSAGMAIQGGFYFSAKNGTVTSAEALANPYQPSVIADSAAFLHNTLLHDVITDTHYDNPSRKGRHVVFLARIMKDYGVAGKGIACDEKTAVCIQPDGLARVFGDYPNSDDNAYFIRPNCDLTDDTPENCSPGLPLHWDRGGAALKVYKIKGNKAGSGVFDLLDWKTGSGGVWEHWAVNQGVLNTQIAGPINCNSKVITQGPQLGSSLFPNPVIDSVLHIDFGDEIVDFVQIFDLQGRLVVDQKMHGQSAIQLDLTQLQHGIFFVKITYERHSEVWKIIVH